MRQGLIVGVALGIGIAIAAGVFALLPQRPGPNPRLPAANQPPTAAAVPTDAVAVPEIVEVAGGAEGRGPFVPGRLMVGDPAPGLSVQRWYRGEARERLEPGFVHVVDLWATWCGPCVRAMPELTLLQAEHREAGLRVLGLSIDSAKNAEEQVERFLENRGETIGFDLALGTETASAEWLEASGRTSIPTSYVVDREGTVVWIGHPQEPDAGGEGTRMERVIREVLEGTFDLDAATAEARKEITKEREAAEAVAKTQGLREEMGKAWAEGDRARTLELIDRIVELDPEANGELAARKVEILMYEQQEFGEATAFAARMIVGPYSDDFETLMRLSALFSGDLDPGPEGRMVGVGAAERAAGLREGDPGVLAQLGHAQFTAGQVSEAVATMERAIEHCSPDDPVREVIEDLAQDYRRSLD